jgi:uncharacterized protein (TIGR01370 family)
MQPIKLFLWLLPSVLIPFNHIKKEENPKTLICYGKLNPIEIKGYDLLIIEPLQYTKLQIATLKKQNKKVIAYISLGEVNSYSKYFNELKKLTLGKNKNWNSYYLNLKNDKTITILNTIIKENFNQGFDGLFLDNIDNFSQFGPQKDDKKYLISFLKNLKNTYTKKTIIQNAGLELLPETHSLIDQIIIESVATKYDFDTKSYNLNDKTFFENYISKINSIAFKYKKPILLIEYANSKKLYINIVNRLKKYKHQYFISTIDLQSIPKFK